MCWAEGLGLEHWEFFLWNIRCSPFGGSIPGWSLLIPGNLKLRPLLHLPRWALHSCVKVDGVVKKGVNSQKSAPKFSKLLLAAQMRV